MNNNRIHLDLGERSYDIVFQSLDHQSVIEAFAALPQKNVLVAADSNTAVYLDKLTASLKAAGKNVYSWVFRDRRNAQKRDPKMAG